MRQTIVIALIAAAFAVAATAEVKCPAGVTCIDAGAGVTSPITTDPVSATGVWTFNNAANTPATFSDGVQLGTGLTIGATGIAQFTTGAFCLDCLKIREQPVRRRTRYRRRGLGARRASRSRVPRRCARQ